MQCLKAGSNRFVLGNIANRIARSITLTVAIAPGLGLADEFCDNINSLADFGVIGESGFTSGNNSTINNQEIQCPDDADSCSGNTPTPNGTLDTANPDFTGLDPATFPISNSTEDRSNPVDLRPGSYDTIAAEKQGNNDPFASFSGGTYYISELVLDGNDSTVVFGAGDYFIDRLTMDSKSIIRTSGGQVRLFIGTSMTGGNQIQINSDGQVSNLVINLYDGAEFTLGNGERGKSDVNFNGILYAPYANTTIDFGNNNDISGAIFSAGTVDVGNNTNFDYSDDVRNEVVSGLGCEPVTDPEIIQIQHDGSTSACGPQSVTVQACADADCNSLFDGTVSGNVIAGANQVSWSLAEGQATTEVQLFLPFDGTQAIDTQTTRLEIDGSIPITCENTTTGNRNNTTACDVAVSRAGFSVDVPDFISAIPQNDVIVTATRLDNDEQCTPLFEDVTRSVAASQDFLDPISGGNRVSIGGDDLPTSLSLSFDGSGQATLPSLNYVDAGRLQLNLRYDGSAATGDAGTTVIGSDSFVVRPASFEIANVACTDGAPVTSIAGEPAGLSAFCRAGEAFSAVIRAVNANGDVTPNFGRETTPESATITHTLLQPAGGLSGALTVPANPIFDDSNGSPAGSANLTDLTWSEVGVIELTATNDNYLETTTGAATGTSEEIGRFKPAYFLATPDTLFLEASCGSFNYQSQPMSFDLPPQVLFEARNLANNRTANYAGDFFRYLAPAVTSISYTSATAPTGVTVAAETPRGTLALDQDLDDASFPYDGHSLTLNGEQVAFSKGLTPPDTSPFTSPVTLQLLASSVTDADDVCVRNSAADPDCDAVLFSDISSPEQRFGRLVVENVYGPETIQLPILMITEYWNGNGFELNTADSCTTLTNQITVLDDPSAISPVADGAGGTLSSGKLASGALFWEPAGEEGRVRFSYSNTDAWLLFDWDETGTPRDPEATATFGRYRGHDRIISWDEI